MTGHTPNRDENQDFLSTMHTMIDDLDTISSNIDENTYLRLVNGLQRLYTIHNSRAQTSSTNYETLAQRQHETFRENFQAANEVQISMTLARHYDRVNDISGNIINSDFHINTNTNTNTNINTNINNNNNDSWNENTPTRNQENARISYTALFTNASDYWNQVVPVVNVIAR